MAGAAGYNPTPETEPAAVEPEAESDGQRWTITDQELLEHCRAERRNSIGFGDGDGGELIRRRERAALFYKGDMSKDIETMDKRSNAVSTDVAEAIDTSLPDLIEIFLGGDDTVTFEPNGEEDEKQARTETDFVNYVLFTLNQGFTAFQTAFKDALLMTTGIFHWWWEEEEKPLQIKGKFTPDVAAAVQQITQNVHGIELQPQQESDDDYVTFQAMQLYGKVKYKAVPPEDFTVSQDTVILGETPYCCLRERARVQELIARGFDRDKIEDLPAYAKPEETISRARDEAGEDDRGVQGSEGPLRMVEVRTHYIRLDIDGDDDIEIVKVTTDFEEKTLIDKEVVDHIPFSSLTPYMTGHRFYGESVADRLLEIQRIKTTLLRMLLDSGYFALNQRFEVSEDKASEYTLSDLLRNEPNMPVRSMTGDAVRPLTGASLDFDAMNALEYISVMGEQRTGIMRNAQGLNPDTLHDTAHGAMALLTAAQKRLRFIARVFAETGIRDLALGIHRTLRCNWRDGMMPLQKKSGSTWSKATPGDWAERDTMRVLVGIGSGGKEQELQVITQQLEIVKELIQMQEGLTGPLVTSENLYSLLMAWSHAAGQKSAERYWSDPSSPDMQQAMQQQQAAKAQQPNPQMAEVQGKLQIAQAEMQGNQQIAQQKIQLDAQVRQAQAAQDAQLQQEQVRANAAEQVARVHTDAAAKQQEAQHKHELAVMEMNGKLALAREEMAMRIQLEREKMEGQLEIQREAARNKPKPGGDD